MIVLDASAGVNIAQDTEIGKALALMLEESEGEFIAACDIYQAEVRNAFWKYARAGLLSSGDAVDLVHDALDLVDEYVSIESLGDEAFMAASAYGHPFYDMLYLCLARRKGATLLTLDKKLAALCQRAGVNCIGEMELN